MKLRPTVAAALLAAASVLGCQHEDRGALSVVVSLPAQENTPNIAKATIQVDYSGSGASILAEGGVPACAFILPGIDGDFVDDRKGTLTIHANGPRALRAPADIVACRMKPGDENATAADLQDKLTVKATAAEDPAGKAIDLANRAPKRSVAEKTAESIEAEQAEAVKAAAATAPTPPPPPAGATGAATAATAVAGVSAGAAGQAQGGPVAVPKAPSGPVPVPSSPGAARATSAQAGSSNASRPIAQAPSLVNNPRAAAQGPGAQPPPSDNSAVPPGGGDRDPSYNDSDADNPAVPAYTLEISVVNATVPLGALQIDINHLGGSGGFIGRGDQIDCAPRVEALVAANYAGERLAKVGLISLQGIRTPTPLVNCGFRTREPLSPASFQITVTDASDTMQNTTAEEPLDPAPIVAVTSVIRR